MNDFDAHTVQNYRVVAGRAARRFANTRKSEFRESLEAFVCLCYRQKSLKNELPSA
jgi:hypothetical protein